jgi:hypothetical protein
MSYIKVLNDYVESSTKEDKSFMATTDLNSISGTSESPYFFLKNPAASGKTLVITHLHVGVNSSSARSIYRLYANPTTSADGTALTECNAHVKSSPVSSVMTTFKEPTVSANGDLFDTKIVSADNGSNGLNRWLYVDEGNTVLITVENDVSNTSTLCSVWWLEL